MATAQPWNHEPSQWPDESDWNNEPSIADELLGRTSSGFYQDCASPTSESCQLLLSPLRGSGDDNEDLPIVHDLDDETGIKPVTLDTGSGLLSYEDYYNILRSVPTGNKASAGAAKMAYTMYTWRKALGSDVAIPLIRCVERMLVLHHYERKPLWHTTEEFVASVSEETPANDILAALREYVAWNPASFMAPPPGCDPYEPRVERRGRPRKKRVGDEVTQVPRSRGRPRKRPQPPPNP